MSLHVQDNKLYFYTEQGLVRSEPMESDKVEIVTSAFKAVQLEAGIRKPHPEGDWFRETWVAPQKFHPEGYPAPRAAASAIYFVLAPGEVSMWRNIRTHELWIWQRGSPLELLFGGSDELPSSSPLLTRLGPSLETGEVPQAIVPGGGMAKGPSHRWRDARHLHRCAGL
ncbi:RmlC-like cupin domain-containing protein [Dissophora ornata]|nr:RmlC-like cupin domain-containing protein [Dissophora ornata]